MNEEEKQKGHDLVGRISGAITLYATLEHVNGSVVEAGRHPDAEGEFTQSPAIVTALVTTLTNASIPCDAIVRGVY